MDRPIELKPITAADLGFLSQLQYYYYSYASQCWTADFYYIGSGQWYYTPQPALSGLRSLSKFDPTSNALTIVARYKKGDDNEVPPASGTLYFHNGISYNGNIIQDGRFAHPASARKIASPYYFTAYPLQVVK